MWKNQGSWNFFHTKLIPNSSIVIIHSEVPFFICYSLYSFGPFDDGADDWFTCILVDNTHFVHSLCVQTDG